MAEPDALGALRAGRKEDLGGGGVGIFLEEVMLDLPGEVDADPIGELHLVERLLKQPELCAFGPRPRQLMLVENPEPHDIVPSLNDTPWRRCARVTRPLRRGMPASRPWRTSATAP